MFGYRRRRASSIVSNRDANIKMEKKAWSKVVAGEWRSIIGFIVAPLVPGMLMALPDVLRGDPMARWYIEFAATAGYPVMLILGVPMYILSKRWKWTGF